MNLIERKRSFPGARAEPPPPSPVDRATFERWAERQEGRYEWVWGEIVMMVQVTRGHADISANVLIALAAVIDRTVYQLSAAEFGVETKAGIRYPDLVVDRRTGDRRERSAKAPLFIGEVLSPSNESVDLIEKADEYTAIESLGTYAVFSPDEPRVRVWQRGEAGFPPEPETIEGPEAKLEIPVLGVTLPLAEIYRNLG
jgi:Uma2 family endonuclease